MEIKVPTTKSMKSALLVELGLACGYIAGVEAFVHFASMGTAAG